MFALAGLVIGLLVCFMAYLFWRSSLLEKGRSIIAAAEAESRTRSESILEEARAAARAIEKQTLESEREVSRKAAQVEARENNCQEQLQNIRKQQSELESLRESLEKQQTEAAGLQERYSKQLEKLAGLSCEEARESLLAEARSRSETEARNLEHRIVEEAKLNAENQARKIIAVAIHRYSGEYTFDSTTATLSLPNEEIKGRIIGREGRNIRAFEMATGITVLIDDTPNAVVLSGFDPVRREIAKVAMQRLITDGRIHPTRIEEVVEKSREEIEQVITYSGYEAQTKLLIPVFNQEITHILGKLKFRLSYSQNILDHSIEVAQICGILAAELGCDVKIAKQCGLLHDIGKAINHEKEGGHAIVGADFLKQQGVAPEVVNGVASHHFEVEPEGPYGILVSAADAISAARPGARSETLSTYLNRIEALEKLADSMPGIKKSFAVHAGREIRVLANADEIDDDAAKKLARNLARAIEEQIQYPGQIRVTVIRETRCVEFAK